MSILLVGERGQGNIHKKTQARLADCFSLAPGFRRVSGVERKSQSLSLLLRCHCVFTFIAFRRNKSARHVSGFPLINFNANAQSRRDRRRIYFRKR
jgi:hypothetical protein